MHHDDLTRSDNSLTSGHTNFELTTPTLSEDYAEIGIGEEEGDYSTPAARNYELDRTQITLNEIIGVGQFGDVHIGTCRIKQKTEKMDSSQKDDDCVVSATSTNGENNNENKLGVIHVAVKTFKADADMTTSEKFLEEACKLCCKHIKSAIVYLHDGFVAYARH